MENRKEPCIYEDEIDLYELWLKLKKRWKVIVKTVAIFLFIALAYIITAKPVYKSSFLIKTYPLALEKGVFYPINPAEVSKTIENLKFYLKEKRYSELAKLLNAKENIVFSLEDLKSNPLRGSQDILEVTLEVYNPKVIQIFTKHLIKYLNKQLSKILISYKVALTEKLKTLSNILQQLKQEKYKFLSEKVSDIKGLAEIDANIIQLEKEIASLKAQLKQLKAIELVTPPVIPKKPYKPKKVLILAVATVSSLFIGTFIALFLDWLDEARRRYNEEENLS
jgi:LPS O-antigen subunit length determinant protein (WzzB/FepE family)